jgi:hypothetical protein
MQWIPLCLIAEKLWHSDKAALNQEEASLHGLDPLMDTASKCPGFDKPKFSLNHRGSDMYPNTGMSAGQIIGIINGLQVIGLDIVKHVFQMHTVSMGTGEIVNVQIKCANVSEYFANHALCLIVI